MSTPIPTLDNKLGCNVNHTTKPVACAMRTASRKDSHSHTCAQRTLLYGLVSVAILSLSGCLKSSGVKDDQPTLASLEDISQQVNPESLPASTQINALNTYQELASSTSDEELRARAMERLADLQLELHQQRSADAVEKPKDKIGTAAPVSVEQESDDYGKVARQYEELLQRNPNSAENERLLYQLGRAYDLAGEVDKTLESMDRLLKQFPDTRLKEELNFRRGELLFQTKDFTQAEQAYAKVIANKDSEYYERALYKHSWCLFKENKLEDSLDAFYGILDHYFKDGKDMKSLSRSEQEIVTDTLRVISLAFSYQEGAVTLKSYSAKHLDRAYNHYVYEALAEHYIEQDRKEDAAATYAAFIDNNPLSKSAPEFFLKKMEIYKQGGFTKPYTQAKEDFIRLFGFSTAYWTDRDPGEKQDIAPQLKEHITELAKHYHSNGQKNKDPKALHQAAIYYREFIASFPQDPETGEMNFLLAEALNEAGEYLEAAAEYEKAAYNYPQFDKRETAGYAAILAFQKHSEDLKGAPRDIAREDTIRSSLRFADEFPDNEKTPKVLIKVAEEQVDLKLLPEATSVAYRITQLSAAGLDAIKATAWAIIAKAEFDQGNNRGAELASLQRIKMGGGTDKEREAQIERLAASIYKQGEQARAEGKLQEAAEHFLRIGNLAPNASIRPTAEYDAAAAYLQLEDWNAAIPVLNRFIRSFPDHKFIDGAIDKLAVAYENSENWAYAAATYQEIARRSKDGKRRGDLQWKTADLYLKAGLKDNAMEMFKEYIKDFPKPAEPAVEARLKLADMYKAANDNGKRQYWLQQIIEADKNDGSTERTRFLAANAAIELAQPTYAAYLEVKLVQPLKTNLKRKKELLEDSIKVFTNAANYGVADVTTAATFMIADAYNEFSKSLFKSERPKGLDTTALEEYEALLEEQAYPFEEKSINVHETNADRTQQGVYDEWVKKSLQALRKLLPARYAKNEKSEQFNSLIN